MSLTRILREDAEEMYRVTDALFGLVDDLEWKPSSGTNWMTTGQLLYHCAEACGKTLNGFVTGDWGVPAEEVPDEMPTEDMLPKADEMASVESVDEARRMLAEDRALCMEAIGKAGEERLLNERFAPPWGGPERSLFQHCHEMIWHLGQHKGQLYYYLKLQGKPVNTFHLWMGGQ